MADTFIISGIGAGSQTGWSSAAVENVADGVFPDGVASLSMPMPVVGPDGINGLHQTFNFVTGYTPPVGSTRLDFTTTLRPVAAPGYVAFKSGTQQVENVAQGIFAEGFESQSIGNTLFSDRPPLTEFDFLLLGDPSLALHFTFGGASVVAGTGFESFVAGATDIEGVVSAAPDGVPSLRFGTSRISDAAISGRLVDFSNFAVGTPELALHFNFGGASVLAASGAYTFAPGSADVENDAAGIFAQGVDSLNTNLPIVAPPVLARNIGFEFFELKSQSGANVAFTFGNSRTAQVPAGFQLTEYGTDITTRFIMYPTGWYSFGGLEVYVRRPGEVIPFGIDSLIFGEWFTPQLTPAGIKSLVFGQTDTEVIAPPAEQFAAVEEGLDSPEFGGQWVSNFWRFVVVNGLYQFGSGEPWASFWVRTIQTPFDFETSEIPRFLVGFHQDIFVGGSDRTAWGLIDVDVPRITTEGHDSAELSTDIWTSRSPRHFFPFPHQSLVPGEHKIHNDLQFVNQLVWCNMQGTHCGPEFGREPFTLVANRDKTISGYGVESLRMALWPLAIENAARAYPWEGFESLQYPPFKSWHLVAHRVRLLPMDGTYTFRTVSYNLVYNDADALYPPGIDISVVGSFGYELLRQFLRDFGFQSLAIPQVWVSRAPRSVTVKTNNSSLQVPRDFLAGNAQEFVPMQGFDKPAFGDFWFKLLPIPTLTPRWQPMYEQDQQLFGYGRVWNFTPQLWPAGRYMFDSKPSKHWISFLNREVAPPSADVLRLGNKTEISDTEQEILTKGFVIHLFSQEAFVWNTDPDPPSDRLYLFDGFDSLALATYSGSVRLNAISFDESEDADKRGINSFRAGEGTDLESMGILFESQHHNPWGLTGYGRAWLSGGVRYIHSFGEDNPNFSAGLSRGGGTVLTMDMLVMPKQRVSPHTIWCRLDTPQQAKDNHPGEPFCEVDRFCSFASHPFEPFAASPDVGPWFGWAFVTTPALQTPSIVCPSSNVTASNKTCHRIFGVFGDTQVELQNRTVYPESWRAFRAGFPIVLGAELQEIVQWPSDKPDSVFAEPVVLDMGPQELAGISLGGSLAMGDWFAENFNRYYVVGGADFTIYGDNTPMVHFPREVTPIEGDLTLYGDQWVSHSPRWLQMVGTVMFEAYWTEYALRMQTDLMLFRVLGYRYNVFSAFGQLTISTGTAELGPYGINPPCVSPWVEVEDVVI